MTLTKKLNKVSRIINFLPETKKREFFCQMGITNCSSSFVEKTTRTTPKIYNLDKKKLHLQDFFCFLEFDNLNLNSIHLTHSTKRRLGPNP